MSGARTKTQFYAVEAGYEPGKCAGALRSEESSRGSNQKWQDSTFSREALGEPSG